MFRKNLTSLDIAKLELQTLNETGVCGIIALDAQGFGELKDHLPFTKLSLDGVMLKDSQSVVMMEYGNTRLYEVSKATGDNDQVKNHFSWLALEFKSTTSFETKLGWEKDDNLMVEVLFSATMYRDGLTHAWFGDEAGYSYLPNSRFFAESFAHINNIVEERYGKDVNY